VEPKFSLPLYNSRPPVPMLSQINPVHAPPPPLIPLPDGRIILPSTRGSPKRSLSPGFPHQNAVCISPLPHTYYMLRPSHEFRSDHLINICRGVQIIKLFIMQCSLQSRNHIKPKGNYLDLLKYCKELCVLPTQCKVVFCLTHTINGDYCSGKPGSSVGIVTELRAGRSGIESQWGRDFPPTQTGPWAHLASCKMGTRSLPGVKCGRGVLPTTHPLLVPRSWKSRAIPLPTLWVTSALQRELTLPVHNYLIMWLLS
jgi:hypothetical protein